MRPTAAILAKPWRIGPLVGLVAVLLALLTVLALSAFAWFERRIALEDARARNELLARVLEDHVTRTVETAALALATLNESVALQPNTEPGRLQPLLAQAMPGLPFMRSLAVLDLHGHVLASSTLAERGLRIDLRLLGTLPAEGRDLLAPPQAGRGLADLASAARAPLAPSLTMLPLWRQMRGPGGERLLLLALINPDALANYQQSVLSDPSGLALLTRYDGSVLAATQLLAQESGQRLQGHPVFDEWLPAREHGSYVGTGTNAGPQVVAFRVSRTRPLVVLVEQSQLAALAAWRQNLLWLLPIGLGALLLIAGTAAVVLRSLRARSQARRELNRAHEQVALREREMSVLLKSVQELIFRTDAEGVLSFVNARWGAISQARGDQALGRRLPDLVIPADRERVAELFSLSDRTGVRSAEASVLTSDGILRRFDLAVVPLHGQGRILGFAGSAVDVSERYAAQARLQHQLAFTGLLLELSPQPISMIDIHRRYVSVNKAWEDFTGRRRADVIGTEVGHFMPVAERAVHEAQDQRLLSEGGRLRYETQLLHSDGQRRDMVVTKVMVRDEHGEPAGILATLMDVSEFRDAERATREARDVAEEASRATSEFVANMSHELRTPLQSSLGFSELGMMRGRDQPKLMSMFTDIHASGQRMLALVNDLLDVSKIESPVGTFDLERSDVRGLVQSVLRELDPLMARRQLRLSLALPEEPLVAKVDPLRFQQVVRNVVANAIKFSPEGGELQVRGELTPQGEIHLSVADQGPGIPPAELESIFEAFVQSSHTKDGSGGTGLGLAICRKIIEIHGGRIHATNREGGGSVFHIYLPLRPAGDTQMSTLL
ncbi:ATP-binding protein [Paucibacter sp. XJ19-41]|uniref:ATP-binding protein n=1 Tax=Paucibacter sp. XJ19-41 TaxID=2927824 RepID=UPI00234AADA9|nr:ATP-binding protein [Paucibacter sp. XJ19-41]MDC6170457.1 ATP-binding protein [Paucibacter sp. XJ19-41]